MNGKNFLDWVGAALIKHPHGDILRELGDFEFDDSKYEHEDSKWCINILGRTAVVLEEQEKRLKEEEYKEKLIHFNRALFAPNTYTEHKVEVHQRLNWKYQCPEAVMIPSKLSSL